MTDISYVIDKVNRHMRALQIIAGNATYFPDGYSMTWNGFSVWYYDSEENGTAKKQMANAIRAMRRAIPGCIVTKHYTDHSFKVEIVSTDNLTIRFETSRENVCEKVEIGTQMVEEIDYENVPKKMVEKPIIEWQCDSILESA